MNEIPVLDHGYIALVEGWGSDERIVEAARMSTQKGFQGWGTPEKPGDEKLLAYLWKNKHFTPFEMAGMTIEVKAPIFVFREWHRHRTQGYNEMSARYAPLPDENYIPSIDRIMRRGGDHLQKGNKQAGAVADAPGLTESAAQAFQHDLRESYRFAQMAYQDALDDGVPKELARLVLPVGRYSKMRATANLRNWFAFLALRDHKDAQWEIRQYARVVAELIRAQFPQTYALYKGDK